MSGRRRRHLAASSAGAPTAVRAEATDLLVEISDSHRCGTGSTAPSQPRQIADARRRFEEFLGVHGVDGLGDLSRHVERDRFERPQLPPILLVAYVAEIARPGASRGTTRAVWNKLANALRSEGWTIPGLEAGLDGSSTPVAQALKALINNLDEPDARPARPVLPGDGLESIARTIAAIDHEVLRQVMLTFHAVSFWTASRVTEASCLMRWGWIKGLDEPTDRLEVTFPPGLKYQARAVSVPVDRYDAEPLACAVTQLRALRQFMADLGFRTDPDSPVLPGVTTTAAGAASLTVDAVSAMVDDPSWRSDITPEQRNSYAQANHASNYRSRWRAAALASGFEETPDRRVSAHGLRRGLATALDLAGMDIERIQVVLRHGQPVVSVRYVDGLMHELSAVNNLIQLDECIPVAGEPVQPEHLGRILIDDLVEADDWEPLITDDVEAVGCGGDLDWQAGCAATWNGERCGRVRVHVWSYLVDGERRVLCLDHIKRLRANEADWERPRRACEIVHTPDDGDPQTCGSTKGGFGQRLETGESMFMCAAHAARYRSGKRGADLTRPIRRHRPLV